MSPAVGPRVLVLGHQKSGTTLIGAAVAESLGLPFVNDLYTDIGDSMRRARADWSADAIWKEEKTLVRGGMVLKEPNLVWDIPGAMRVLGPFDKVICVKRDPVATIQSIIGRLGVTGRDLMLEKRAFHSLPLAWQTILDGAGVDAEFSGGHIERLALRVRAASRCISRTETSSVRFCVSYERFLQEPQAELERCGINVKGPIRALDVQHQPSGRNRSERSTLGPAASALIRSIDGLGR